MGQNRPLWIGTHLSVAKGYARMGKDAVSIGANTLQFFARNPRGTKAKEIDETDLLAFCKIIKENKFGPMIAHAPYTMNPCSSDRHIRELAGEMFQDDLKRMELIPGNLYNFHPGSRLKQEKEDAIGQIADLLNQVLFPDMQTTVLLETMSGKGSEVGQTFEEIKAILDRVELSKKVGVCMDACHMWDAGYNIVDNLDGVLDLFDQIIGLKKLCAFHINDSLNGMGSHKDRHAMLGDGKIGKDAVIRIINHKKLKHLPFILETPTNLDGHAKEILMLRDSERQIVI